MILQARRYIGDGTIIGLSRGFAACKIGSSEPRFELDMSQVPFLRVGQICLLAMYCMWVRGQLRNSSIMGLPPESDLFHYLQRIDFFKYLGVEVEESFCRHDSDTFVEIREIINDESNTANDIPAKFRRIVEATSQLDGSVVSAVDRSFGEILDNVLTHSHTRIPGIAIAQFYPREHYIEFCVADCGIVLSESDLDFDGGGSSRRPFYWDDKGNELEDFCEDAILW